MAPHVALVPIFVLGLVHTPHLPSYIPRCYRHDPSFDRCLKTAIELSFSLLANGIPELGFPPLDPWNAGTVELRSVVGGEEVHMKLDNITAHRLSRTRVQFVRSELQCSRLSIRMSHPHVSLEAAYELNGTLIGRPLASSGRSFIEFRNVEGLLEITGNMLSRDYHEYFDVANVTIHLLSVGAVNFQFDNLDEQRGRNEEMNNMINQNELKFWESFRPKWIAAFSFKLNDLTRKIFSQVPVDEIFLN